MQQVVAGRNLQSQIACNLAISSPVIENLLTFGNSPDSEMTKLVWLVRLRWAAAFLFLILAGPAFVFKLLDSTTLLIYIGIICGLFFFNGFTHFAFVETRKKITPIFICFQIAFDVLVLFSLLLITKSFNNPFICLFLINAGLGGVLIRGKYAVPFILLCHVLLMALQLHFEINHSAEIDLMVLGLFATSHLLLFTTWIVMSSLGRYLENHFENLSTLRLRAEKQDRLRALGALAAGFSHEFASPLNVAKLRLDRLERQLEKSQANSELAENIIEAKAGIEACENVIHQMNSSQLDVRDFKVKTLSINSLIHDITESWKEENPTAKLKIDLPQEVSLQIAPINFAQVLLNLLDNAFEATNDGLIRLSFAVKDTQAELIVEDEGPGFSALVLERQGEPFITTKKEGTGLGLYVSQLFAQSLGGQLNISNSQSGAKVTLTWPMGSL